MLGPTGVNFGAGMSGGIAYIYDPNREFADKCNMELVSLESVVDETESNWLYDVIAEHKSTTGSAVAGRILDDWAGQLDCFVKVFPNDYKAVLEQRAEGAGMLLSDVIVNSITATQGSKLDALIEARQAERQQPQA